MSDHPNLETDDYVPVFLAAGEPVGQGRGPVSTEDLRRKMQRLVEQRKYAKAFKACVGLTMAMSELGAGREVVQASIVEHGKYFNHLSMQMLNGGKVVESQRLFAQILSFLKKFDGEEVHTLVGLTLNNMSCSYKRNGQIDEAQKCLQRALELQERIQADDDVQEQLYDNGLQVKFEKSPKRSLQTAHTRGPSSAERFSRAIVSPKQDKNEFALTELNLCAIYSQKGDHMKAKMYAHSAIYKLNQDLEYTERKLLEEQQRQDTDHEAIRDIEEKVREKHSLLAIAHYNLGCQQEYLKEYQRSMESYKRAVQLERGKQRIGGQAEQGALINEFIQSYRDMKRKITSLGKQKKAPQEHDRNAKKTFSGLTKLQIDESSSNFSLFHKMGTQPGSANRLSMRKTDKESMQSRYSNRNLIAHSKNINDALQNRRKRPVSAKNPMLQNRLHRHEVSTPHLVGEDIIDIQDQVINEEDHGQASIEREREPYERPGCAIGTQAESGHYAPQSGPKSRGRKPRPVSSYVNKKSQDPFSITNSLQKDNPNTNHYDRINSGKLNFGSRHSEMSKHMSAEITNQPDAQRRQAQDLFYREQRQEDDVYTIKSSTATLMQRPLLPRLQGQPPKPPGTRQLGGQQRGGLTKSKQTSLYTAQTMQPQPQRRLATFSSRATLNQQARALQNRPTLPRSSQGSSSFSNVDSFFKAGKGRPSSGARPLKPAVARSKQASVNKDLPGGEGEQLMAYIDKNYEQIQKADVLKRHRLLVAANGAGSVEELYTQEISKQREVLSTNIKLDKDITKFTQNRAKILNSLKNTGHVGRQQPDGRRSRPQTAKILQSKASATNIQIEEQEKEEISDSRDGSLHPYDQVKTYGVGEQAYSQSRSRSRSHSRSQNRKKPQRESKSRPHSAYPVNQKQRASGGSKLKGDFFFPQQHFPTSWQAAKTMTRVWSAGVRRPVIADLKKGEGSRRQRPQNRPTAVRGRSSPVLDEIDEFGSGGSGGDAETQMLYRQSLSYDTRSKHQPYQPEPRMSSRDDGSHASNTEAQPLSVGQANVPDSLKHTQAPVLASTAHFQSSKSKEAASQLRFDAQSPPSRYQSTKQNKKHKMTSVLASQTLRSSKAYASSKVQSAKGSIKSLKIGKASQAKDYVTAEVRQEFGLGEERQPARGESSVGSQHPEVINNILIRRSQEKVQRLRASEESEGPEVRAKSEHEADEEALLQRDSGLAEVEEDNKFDTFNREPENVSLRWSLTRRSVLGAAEEEENSLPSDEREDAPQMPAGPEPLLEDAGEILRRLRLQRLNTIAQSLGRPRQFRSFSDVLASKRDYASKIFLGKQTELRIPITPFDPEEIDEARADAIARAFTKDPVIELEQCAYKSKDYNGLCKLVFLFRPQLHVLQIVLFKPTYQDVLDPKYARMNREVNLTSFNIPKVNPYREGTEELEREQVVGRLYQERWRVSLSVVEAVRRLKLAFTGSIYDDFFHFGAPNSTAFDATQRFQIRLLSPAQLKELVEEQVEQQLQFEHFSRRPAFRRVTFAEVQLDWLDFCLLVVRLQRFARRARAAVKRRHLYRKDNPILEEIYFSGDHASSVGFRYLAKISRDAPREEAEVSPRSPKKVSLTEQRHELRRKQLDSSTKKAKPSRRLQFENDSGYGQLFKNRSLLLEQTTVDQTKLKRDDDMGRSQVRNMYEYAVIKIQKWWRRHAFTRAGENALRAGGRHSRGGHAQLSKHVSGIELELKILRDLQARLKKSSIVEDLPAECDYDKVVALQKFWRTRRHAQRLARGWQDHRGDMNLVHASVREFNESVDDMFPSNYTVTVRQAEVSGEFVVSLCLNNKPQLQEQRITLPVWSIDQDRREKKHLQRAGLGHYFAELVHERLVYVPYSEEELNGIKLAIQERQAKQASPSTPFSLFGWIRGPSKKPPAVIPVNPNNGTFRILTIEEFFGQDASFLRESSESQPSPLPQPDTIPSQIQEQPTQAYGLQTVIKPRKGSTRPRKMKKP